MKDKIFNSLKQTYSNLGLSDEILQGQAGALANTGFVTDDNLATVVAGQKTFLSSLQSGIDKRVTDALNKAKAEKQEKTDEGGDQDKNEPANIQALIDAAIAVHLNPLQERLNAYEAKDKSAARASMINEKAKELGISSELMAIINVPDTLDDQGISDYLTNVKKYDVVRGLESSNASGVLSTSDEKAKEYADEWAKNLPDAN
jgi:hypothetical protein